MNDYEKLADELGSIGDRIEGLSVDDEDLAALIAEASQALDQARALAEDRGCEVGA